MAVCQSALPPSAAGQSTGWGGGAEVPGADEGAELEDEPLPPQPARTAAAPAAP